MTDIALPFGESGDPSTELAVSVEPEGVLVAGDRSLVGEYLERVKDLAGDATEVIGLNRSSIANGGAVGAGVLSVAMQHGQFVRLSPDSLAKLREFNVLPGTAGYNRMTVVDSANKFRGQLQWQNVALGPSQALSLQMIAVQVALKSAIASVEAAVERVEGTVEQVLTIAEASRAGDVVGHHAALARLVADLDETGALPTADWDSVAGLGPALEVGVERLREHLKRTLKGFDTDKPIQDRAAYLQRAVENNRLGESLMLLVIAEESLYLWQRLRIARVAATEPNHLSTVTESARRMLAEHLERDGQLLVHARAELASYAAVKPLEILRWMSSSSVKRDMATLREDLDSFAVARRSQVTGWVEHEDPRISDALDELGDRAKVIGVAAKELGARAVDAGAFGLGRLGGKLQKVAETRKVSRGPDADGL